MSKAETAPKELRDLDARLARLRERLKTGDPEHTADELQVAIERAEAKRVEIQASLPQARQSVKVLSMLPNAASLYRKQIADCLAGDERAALKARVILRDLLGPISLTPGTKGELWAEYKWNPALLLK